MIKLKNGDIGSSRPASSHIFYPTNSTKATTRIESDVDFRYRINPLIRELLVEVNIIRILIGAHYTVHWPARGCWICPNGLWNTVNGVG